MSDICYEIKWVRTNEPRIYRTKNLEYALNKVESLLNEGYVVTIIPVTRSLL